MDYPCMHIIQKLLYEFMYFVLLQGLHGKSGDITEEEAGVEGC